MKKLLLAALMLCATTVGYAQLIKEREPIDPKYLIGAVTQVDGVVTFDRTLDVPGVEAQSLYKQTLHWLGQYFKKEDVLSRKTLSRDSVQCYIAVGINEYIVFKNTTLCLDRSQLIFSLAVQCADNSVQVKMDNISYYYDEERQPQKYIAEEWITDAASLNKKGTKLLPISGKFRVKTIDAFDDICNALQSFLATATR
jgi:colicin import membrane protein